MEREGGKLGKMKKGKMEIKENEKCNGKKDRKKAEDPFFFFAFHFSETSETFSGSLKIEISTGKKSGKVALPPPPKNEKFSCCAPGHRQYGVT